MNKKSNKNNKRASAKRQDSVGAAVTIPYGPAAAAFPVSLRTQLRYAAVGTMVAAAAGTTAYQTYRMNSLYDPDHTGVGSQPAGFAAAATLYNKYRVVGLHVKISVGNDSGGTVNVVIFQSPSATIPSSFVSCSQQPYGERYLLADQSGGPNVLQYQKKLTPWSVLGVTKSRYLNDDQFAAAVTTNPTAVSYLNIVLGGVTIAANCQYQTEIVYDVVLFDRVNYV